MARDTTQFSPDPGGTILSYVEVTGWEIRSDRCVFTAVGGVTSPYGWGGGPNITAQLQYWTGSWHDYGTDEYPDAQGSGRFYGYNDLQLAEVVDYFARQDDDRTVSVGCYASGSPNGVSSGARAWIDYTVPHKAPAVVGLSASYVSDNRIDLTWTAPSRSYEAMCIEVSIDGGAWSEFAVLRNTATSYSYTQASAGHSYAFRIRTYYKAGYSAYDTWNGTIYTTPTAPTAISTEAAQGTSVTINVTNAMQSPYKLQYEVSTDDGANWGTTQTSASLTSFSVSISGIGKVRVRNVYDGVDPLRASSWLVSDRIITSAQPNAPTIVSPSDGGTVDIADGSVTLTWLHNPVDGSAQSMAELFYESEGGATDTVDITGDAQSHTLEFGSGFAVGDLVYWKVRTWGSFATPSPWAEADFTLYSAPTASMTFPGTETRDGSIYVVGMPIELDASYSDMTNFECVYAQVILSQNGRTIRTSDTDNGEVRIVGEVNQQRIQATLTVDEFLPANGESYTVVLNVRSSSGLQSTSNAVLNIDFIEPPDGALEITNDPDTGHVSLLATYDNTGAEAPAQSISVSRINADGSITPLLTNGASGSGIVDRYAPLNNDYQYAVTTMAASKAVKTVYVTNRIDSLYWFAYWGDEVAKAKWNPSGSVAISRPEKRRVHYVGREYPVSYDSKAIDQVNAVKFAYLDNVDDFVRLMHAGGRGIYKGCDGWVFHADFDFGDTADYASVTRMGELSLTVYRIEGAKL